MKKKENIKNLFTLTREAVVGVKGKKIQFANPAAELLLGMNPEGMAAESLLPAYLLENEAESFVCTLQAAGKPCTASVSSVDGLRLVCLSASGGGGEILPALASNVTTVMRSSLGTLRAALDQLSQQVSAQGNEKVSSYMGVIYKDYFRLFRTTRQLSVLGGTAKLQSDARNADCVDVWSKAVDTVGGFTEARGVLLRFNCTEPQLFVRGNQEAMEELLLNLLSNSLGAGSTEIDIDLRLHGKKAILTVRDNGSGIEPEVLATVFSRFEQMLSPRELSYGAGIGLFVVKTIVERSGGALLIESRPENGTCVMIQLPVEENPGLHEPVLRTASMDAILRELSPYLQSSDYCEKFLGD